MKIAVIATCSSMLTKAKRIAKKLSLPLIENGKIPDHFLFLLAVTPGRVELRENSSKRSNPIFVDFISPKLNYRIKYGGGKSQLLARAVGIKGGKRPVVIDATAGFGVDAFILASLGCEVLMLERSPIVGVLLEDGLKRLKKANGFQNLKLKICQAIDYILKKIVSPDVIYLDPMYPERFKSALNKKTMRILHTLVGKDDDASELLKIALKRVKNRVVVKRPKLAASLGEIKPDLTLSSAGSCRYDIYFPKDKINNLD